MITSEKSHQILSDNNQFLFLKKIEKDKKKTIFSNDKMRNSGNCIHDYAHSYFGEDF